MNIEPNTFRLVSLGCPKNLVDSEVMAGYLLAAGWRLVPDGPAQLCLVNTCSFVEDAAQESVDILLEQAQRKAEGEFELLIATGCLPEKYRKEVVDAIKGVDAEIGTEDFPKIVSIVEALLSGKGDRIFLSDHKYLYNETTPRILSGPPWRAYLKIAEGCDNRCSYCIIGSLRGPFRSRKTASIIAEAENLAEMGVKELILVAQDVSNFGADRPGDPGLAKLLYELNQINGLEWIRLLYAHPAHMTKEILEAMAANDKVLHYLDLPIQHASDPMLKKMNRKAGIDQIKKLLDQARQIMPDIIFRTTFIVGLPGESQEDFARLVDFVKEQRFANVGAFAYSPEENTPAFTMEPKVPQKIAQARLDEIMTVQQKIAEQIWRDFMGRSIEVLIEEKLYSVESSDFTHVGRIYGQAPEIDGLTYCRLTSGALEGSILKLKAIDATGYDLFAEE